jgi:hypothetical protein
MTPSTNKGRNMGFDHGAGHPLLFLDDAKAPNFRKNNGFKDLDNYSERPKVAGAVIKAPRTPGENLEQYIFAARFWGRPGSGLTKRLSCVLQHFDSRGSQGAIASE